MSRKALFLVIQQVAPIMVAAIFYAIFEEVNAYQKTEKV